MTTESLISDPVTPILLFWKVLVNFTSPVLISAIMILGIRIYGVELTIHVSPYFTILWVFLIYINVGLLHVCAIMLDLGPV